MRHLVYAVALLGFGAIAVLYASAPALGAATFGAVAATGLWLYFSLRPTERGHSAGHSPMYSGSGTTLIGDTGATDGYAHACGDLSHGGVSCDGGSGGGDAGAAH